MGENATAATEGVRPSRRFAGGLPWDPEPATGGPAGSRAPARADRGPGEFASSAPVRGPRRPEPQQSSPRPSPSELEELGRRTATVAHDFNNLLAVIMACAGEIAAGAAGAQLERAEEIREAARRGVELSRALLAARAGEGGGRPEPVPGPLAVAAALAESRKLIERALGPEIRLAIEVDPALPRAAIAASELERVLLNLAANCRDAMPAGGTVTIVAATVAIAPGDPVLGTGWHVRIRFADDGPGMSPEIARRALEPYFTTKGGAGGGSGLGLAGARAIIRAAGGELRIDSPPGVGTTVSIDLPAADDSGNRLALAPSGA